MEGSQMRANYNIFMIDQLKIFKMIINLVTIIILYVLLLALLVGVANILLNIKSIIFETLGGL
jgi:uncharacterized membrane protein (DUF373 family)